MEMAEQRGRSVPATDATREQAPVLASWQHPAMAGRARIRGDCGMTKRSPNWVCGLEHDDAGDKPDFRRDDAELAVTSLVAHSHINPEAQRELQLALSRALNNAPDGISTAQKQLALIILLEKLTELLPPDSQAQNSVAVVATLLLGPRLLAAVSMSHSENAVQ